MEEAGRKKVKSKFGGFNPGRELRRPVLTAFFILFLLIAIDGWFYGSRKKELFIFQARSYDFFYRGQPVLKRLEYQNGILTGAIDASGFQLKLVDEPEGFYQDGEFRVPIIENRTLVFRDQDGFNYELSLVFNYYAGSKDKIRPDCARGECILQVDYTNFSLNPSAPMAHFWIPTFAPEPGPEIWMEKIAELKKSKPFFKESLPAISGFMIENLKPHLGIPSLRMVKASPAEQIRFLLEKPQEIWCSNVAVITAYSLNSLMIPARMIVSFGKVGSLSLQPHAFNEVLDPENRRWFLCDLAIGILYVENQDGKKLDAVQLSQDLVKRDWSGLKFYYWSGPEAGFARLEYQDLPEQARKNLAEYYGEHHCFIYHSGKSYIYRRHEFVNKLKDYFVGYRYVYAPSLPASYWPGHLLFRASLDLTPVLFLVCGIILLRKIHSLVKKNKS